MLVALDVGYQSSGARAAAVGFADWRSAQAACEETTSIADVKPYVPGEFYRRELPCLLAVLNAMKQHGEAECLVIDGYVWLDNSQKLGLGGHLFAEFQETTPVIGVAKTPFEAAPHQELTRGSSARPLYITSAGVPVEDAVRHIASMHGPFRVPTLLKRVDELSRTPIDAG